MTQPGLGSYLDGKRRQVDAALERFLPASPACPAGVAQAMRYSLFAGGKRLRPILALSAAEAVATVAGDGRLDCTRVGEAVRLALPAACALEMIHTYSLIHDDLPSMDNDTLRRGRPTLHVVHGEAMAILTGDGLLTEAFALLAREPLGGPDVAARKLRTIGLVAAAAGVTGMVGGQVLDLQGLAGSAPDQEEETRDAKVARLRALHAAKTGALIRAATLAGAIMAGAPPALEDAVDRYAAGLGLAFQIVDDILDVEGHAEELGKTTGKDEALGKLTYPALFGLEASRVLAADTINGAIACLAAHGLGDSQLAAIARWTIDRTS